MFALAEHSRAPQKQQPSVRRAYTFSVHLGIESRGRQNVNNLIVFARLAAFRMLGIDQTGSAYNITVNARWPIQMSANISETGIEMLLTCLPRAATVSSFSPHTDSREFSFSRLLAALDVQLETFLFLPRSRRACSCGTFYMKL